MFIDPFYVKILHEHDGRAAEQRLERLRRLEERRRQTGNDRRR